MHGKTTAKRHIMQTFHNYYCCLFDRFNWTFKVQFTTISHDHTSGDNTQDATDESYISYINCKQSSFHSCRPCYSARIINTLLLNFRLSCLLLLPWAKFTQKKLLTITTAIFKHTGCPFYCSTNNINQIPSFSCLILLSSEITDAASLFTPTLFTVWIILRLTMRSVWIILRLTVRSVWVTTRQQTW